MAKTLLIIDGERQEFDTLGVEVAYGGYEGYDVIVSVVTKPPNPSDVVDSAEDGDQHTDDVSKPSSHGILVDGDVSIPAVKPLSEIVDISEFRKQAGVNVYRDGEIIEQGKDEELKTPEYQMDSSKPVPSSVQDLVSREKNIVGKDGVLYVVELPDVIFSSSGKSFYIREVVRSVVLKKEED